MGAAIDVGEEAAKWTGKRGKRGSWSFRARGRGRQVRDVAQLVHWGDVEPVTSRQVRDVGDAAVVSPPGSVRDAWRITRITQARMASLTSRIVRFLSRAASCGARPTDPTSRRCHRAIRRPRQRAAIASSGAAVRGASRAH